MILWHLSNYLIYNNTIDVSHDYTQAISNTPTFLDAGSIYNNIFICHSVGRFTNSSTSKAMFSVELWGMWDLNFYNNKMINGGASLIIGKDADVYGNFIDTRDATNPKTIGLETHQINGLKNHHNYIAADIGGAADGVYGITAGSTQSRPGAGILSDFYVKVWGNVLVGGGGHGIAVLADSVRTHTVYAEVHNNDFLDRDTYYSLNLKQGGASDFGSLKTKNNIFYGNAQAVKVETGTVGRVMDRGQHA